MVDPVGERKVRPLPFLEDVEQRVLIPGAGEAGVVVILYAAKIDPSSNVWKLWVSRESMARLCLVGNSSRHRVMAAVNAS